MPCTRVALVSVWSIVLGLFVLSASGTIAAGNGLTWLVLAALTTPAIILQLTTRLRNTPVVSPAAAGTLKTTGGRDAMRGSGETQ